MDDRNINCTDAGGESENNTPNDVCDKLCRINFIPPDTSGDDFWFEVKNSQASKKLPLKLLGCLITLILVVLIVGYALLLTHGRFSITQLFDNKIEFTLPIAETPTLEDKYYNADGTYTASGLAKAVLPSVVQIQVYSDSALLPTSQGSGIIISEDGYIVTNAHVISKADYGITVELYNKTEYVAELVGSDSSSDIAVLKIAASNLSPAQFADSDVCELGDDVVTIGSPAGYQNSVTKGIISGLDRQISADSGSTSMSCIQIDAAINPGNSGGPLFNMWGQVIGINSSKLVSSSYDNIGFAITINSAKPVIEELMENGYVPDKPRIGITYYPIDEDNAAIMNVEPGLYIYSIDEDCNVAETELAVGDIIMELNGEPAYDTDKVSEIMSNLKGGDTMVCKVYRPSDKEDASIEDGEYFEISFELNSGDASIQETE